MLAIQNMTLQRGQGTQSFTVSLPSLALPDGQIMVIQGKSGCGKSTLLEIIGLILKPDQIDTFQLGHAQDPVDVVPLMTSNDQKALATIRASMLGFMLQNGGLLPFLTIAQNIALPNQLLQTVPDKEWVDSLCERLTITHLLSKYPHQLSIGERQRVAFIRSVAHKPLLLLADEPTSALDPYHADVLIDLILTIVQEQHISALVVTHDWDLAKRKQLPTLQAQLDDSLQQAIFTQEEEV